MKLGCALLALILTRKMQNLCVRFAKTTEEISSLRIEELKKRLNDSSFKEAIIATNPTTEGDATAIYLKKVLESFKLKTTKLGRGLPTGAEVEYADEETLKSALEGRK